MADTAVRIGAAVRAWYEHPVRANRGLYAIVDVEVCARNFLDPVETGAAFLRAELPWVQVRAKHGTDRERLALMRELSRHRYRSTKTALIANDRADLALIAELDGVHVGQGDATVEEIKSRFPQLLVGISTHKFEEMETAMAGASDYVAWGPVFSTTSKANPEPTVGEESLAHVGRLAKERKRALVGIGGIDEARLTSVGSHLDYVAMISALVVGVSAEKNPYERIFERALKLHERLCSIARG